MKNEWTIGEYYESYGECIAVINVSEDVVQVTFSSNLNKYGIKMNSDYIFEWDGNNWVTVLKGMRYENDNS
jgi:hypothetical protein